MMHVRKLARLWRTVHHLRFEQVIGRLWFRIAQPRLDHSPAPLCRKKAVAWQLPARRKTSLIGPDEFLFLNETGSLAEHGWDSPEKSKLWRYNQHYFDDLNAAGAGERSAWHQGLVDEWIGSNPPSQGSGWEPYPTSLRIVNWIKWSLSGNDLTESPNASLAIQVRWLAKRLEWHLLGNHLFANAKALVFAGLYFDGPEAQGWLDLGLRILDRQIPEQILPDGGQFELSPMYHALAIEDLLDLVNIAKTYGREDLAQTWSNNIHPAMTWLQAMSHPDGGIAFFNDAAFGIAPANVELESYAHRLGFPALQSTGPVTHLEHSGYARLAAGPFVLIADFAKVGPDYLPGHAHADTLSIELSIAGQRVFVNSGTSEYGTGPERQRQRGTSAHNTVVVSQQDSSEVWAGFRVGRRARPFGVAIAQHDGTLHAQCSHDGYRYLPGQPTVTRSIKMSSQQLTIFDRVSGNQPAAARYHLHPAIEIKSTADNRVILELPSGGHLSIEIHGQALRVEATTWHPEFGVSIPNRCLVVPLLDGQATLDLKRV